MAPGIEDRQDFRAGCVFLAFRAGTVGSSVVRTRLMMTVVRMVGISA